MKFSEMIQDFFINYLPTTRGYTMNTLSTYQVGMLIFVKYLKSTKINIDDLKIEQININIIEEYIKYLKEIRNNSENTINNRICILKSFFNFIENHNITSLDICSKIKSIKLLRTHKKIPRHFTEEEITFIIQTIPNNNLNEYKELLVFLFLYNCALRASDVCGIKIKDLNVFNDKIPTILIEKSKGGKSRTITITKDFADMIRDYIKKTGLDSDDENYLFVNKYDNPYTRKGIYYIVKKLYKNCRKENNDKTMLTEEIHPHMLRHTKAVHMVEDGINLSVVQRFLDHENLSTTEIYGRIGDKKLSEIILENSNKIKLNKKRPKKEKQDLENWLKNNYKY